MKHNGSYRDEWDKKKGASSWQRASTSTFPYRPFSSTSLCIDLLLLFAVILTFFYIKMRFTALNLALASASFASATNLYVSSYSGAITSLKLSNSYNGSYVLEKTFSSNGSWPSPSWLTLAEGSKDLNSTNRILYCLDENLSGGNGSISSYGTSPSGALTQIDRHSTITGPVSSIIYNNGTAMAAAH